MERLNTLASNAMVVDTIIDTTYMQVVGSHCDVLCTDADGMSASVNSFMLNILSQDTEGFSELFSISN